MRDFPSLFTIQHYIMAATDPRSQLLELAESWGIELVFNELVARMSYADCKEFLEHMEANKDNF